MSAVFQTAALVLTLSMATGCALGTRTVVPSPPEFPWPPPRPSAQWELPDEMFRARPGLVLLRDIDEKLVGALTGAGYDQRSYHSVPDGFALAARLEQINPDGTPKAGPARWAVSVEKLPDFAPSTYLSALLTSRPGLFRVIVFVVTPHAFRATETAPSREEAREWAITGINRLPEALGRQPYSEQHRCTALVYEFEKTPGQSEARVVQPGRLVARMHLERAAIMRGLRN
jgi:hypothetical protein